MTFSTEVASVSLSSAELMMLADSGLVALIRLARQAVIDFRDVRIAADDLRSRAEST